MKHSVVIAIVYHVTVIILSVVIVETEVVVVI